MDGRKPSKAQLRWLAALEAAGAEAYLWYPRDWPQIVQLLARPAGGTPLPWPSGPAVPE
jgi:hypothetical protein